MRVGAFVRDTVHGSSVPGIGHRPGPRPVARVLLVLSILLTAGATGAATILVNDSGDTLHAGPGGCALTGTGTCTLRDAITFANSNPGRDGITSGIGATGRSRSAPADCPPSPGKSLSAATSWSGGRGIDGIAAGSADGLTISADGSTVSNFEIAGFGGASNVVWKLPDRAERRPGNRPRRDRRHGQRRPGSGHGTERPAEPPRPDRSVLQPVLGPGQRDLEQLCGHDVHGRPLRQRDPGPLRLRRGRDAHRLAPGHHRRAGRREIQVGGQYGVPNDAKAVSVNVTAEACRSLPPGRSGAALRPSVFRCFGPGRTTRSSGWPPAGGNCLMPLYGLPTPLPDISPIRRPSRSRPSRGPGNRATGR